MASTPFGARILPFPQGVYTHTVTDNYYNYNNRPKHDYETSLKTVEKAYQDCFCGPMPKPVGSSVLRWIREGVNVDLFSAVMEYTVCTAPRPSWAYACAIIRRKLAEGITTRAAFEESVAMWQRKREQATAAPRPVAPGRGARQPKQVIEQLYQQRCYDPAVVDAFTPEEIEEAMKYDR